MARYTKSRAKLVRAFNENIFGLPKYDKILAKKPYHPGAHGKKMQRRPSDYGQQLKEKQKLKAVYGIQERQFRHYFQTARKTQTATGEKLLQLLESRLDNLVYRAGFSRSRPAARQLVNHNHILVDAQRVNIPSCLVKPGQVISLTQKTAKIPDVATRLANKDVNVPKWLKRQALAAKLIRLPERDEIDTNIQEQLIVEFYSR